MAENKKMREMKDSGIGWVHEIPIDWDVIRGKYLFTNDKMLVGAKVEEYERLALTMKGVVKRSKDDTEGLQPDKFNTYQILRTGELVFKLIDLQNISTSRVGLSPYTGIVSPAYIILKGNEQILPEYAEKYYLMMWMNQVFNALGDSGVRSSLNVGELLELKLPVPPLEEQRRIADFLDRECGKIDAIIADVEKQIEILEQYKRSVITTIVTKGMSSDIHIRERDQWFGGIPIQWEIARIGSLYKLRNTKVNDRDYAPLSVTMQGVVPQLETAAKTNAHDDRKLVRKGDFVINSRSDRRGSCGISSQDGSVSLINIVLTPLQNMNPSYYNWLFHSVGFSDEFYKWGHGIVDDLWTTTWQDMKNIVIPVPPLEEQQAIADYLDKKCAEIDGVIADKKEQLDVLENYKKSLIYEYVTGKKEVV